MKKIGGIIFLCLVSYSLGLFHQGPGCPVVPEAKKAEMALIEFQKIVGDELQFEVFGPVRILWNENMLEEEGVLKMPLGQFSDHEDLKFKKFKYTGNEKTMKFYPSNSYPARGVRVEHRRFFQSIQAAKMSGFVASKLVK